MKEQIKFNSVGKRIFRLLSNMEIIDSHEHLSPEKDRLGENIDVFTLFSDYSRDDLLRAGMKVEEYDNLLRAEIPLEKRWKIFEPYWEMIRYTSFSRSVIISCKKLFGVNDITVKNYQKISELLQQANKPGIYRNILSQLCKIKIAITQFGGTDTGTDLLIPIMPLYYEIYERKDLISPTFAPNNTIESLDEYLYLRKKHILKIKSEGTVGLKMYGLPYMPPNRREADKIFKKVKSGKIKCLDYKDWPRYPVIHPLKDYLVDEIIKFAGEQNLVIAVHTGYWGDFRQLNPTHMIPILLRYPDIKFDIYHIGYPFFREALMLGKNFSNVWLNFCWCHIISQKFAILAMDEAIDLLPSNKILGFGGDYRVVENIYGHLIMALENVTKVLSKRIKDGYLKEYQAIDLAHKWLWDNPKKLYELKDI